MTLDYEDRSGIPMPFDAEDVIRTVTGELLRREGCPFACQLCVQILSEEEIRRVNREYRGIDSVTDVLSFPLVPFPEPSSFESIRDRRGDCFDPDTEELCLGDVLICSKRASEQAENFGHSLRREMAFLAAHSLLHLLGYDHEDAEEAKIMEEKQEAVLEALGITRDLP